MRIWRLGAAEYSDEPDFATEVSRVRRRAVDYSYHATGEEALHGGGADAVEVIFANSKVRLGVEEIGRLPRLKRIVVVTSGYDNIDLEAARERGIEVGRMPQIRTDAVAETVLWLMLSFVRKGWALARLMRVRGGDPWPRAMSREARRLRDLTVGIVGQGEIGRALAALLVPMTRVLATDARPREDCWTEPFRRAHPGVAEQAAWVAMDELLALSDVVTVHVDLNETSRRLIRRKTLARMGPGAILINTSRGEAVEEADLLAALEHLGGVGLDVFATEPLDRGHPLRRHPNVILLPHAAGSWSGMNEATTRAILEEIERAKRGFPPLHPARPVG